MNQFRFSCAADDLALFVSNGWHSLPPQVWFAICKLTGAKPPQWARTAGSIKTVDMQQLLQTCPKESQIIHWVFVGFVLKHYTSKAITNALTDHRSKKSCLPATDRQQKKRNQRAKCIGRT